MTTATPSTEPVLLPSNSPLYTTFYWLLSAALTFLGAYMAIVTIYDLGFNDTLSRAEVLWEQTQLLFCAGMVLKGICLLPSGHRLALWNARSGMPRSSWKPARWDYHNTAAELLMIIGFTLGMTFPTYKAPDVEGVISSVAIAGIIVIMRHRWLAFIGAARADTH